MGFSEDDKGARGEPQRPCSRVKLTSDCLSLDDFFERSLWQGLLGREFIQVSESKEQERGSEKSTRVQI